MNRCGGAVRGLGIGMSNGGAAPGGTLGVGRFEFDDVSAQFPATPDPRHGDYSLPGAGRGNGMIGSGGQVVTVRLRGTPWASLLRRW